MRSNPRRDRGCCGIPTFHPVPVRPRIAEAAPPGDPGPVVGRLPGGAEGGRGYVAEGLAGLDGGQDLLDRAAGHIGTKDQRGQMVGESRGGEVCDLFEPGGAILTRRHDRTLLVGVTARGEGLARGHGAAVIAQEISLGTVWRRSLTLRAVGPPGLLALRNAVPMPSGFQPAPSALPPGALLPSLGMSWAAGVLRPDKASCGAPSSAPRPMRRPQ